MKVNAIGIRFTFPICCGGLFNWNDRTLVGKSQIQIN